jgi:hypothetical protein
MGTITISGDAKITIQKLNGDTITMTDATHSHRSEEDEQLMKMYAERDAARKKQEERRPPARTP